MGKLATGLALAVLSATSASAADETFDVTFSAHNFTSQFGQPAVDPVSGSFQITIDPTKTYLNETTGITLQTLNLALSSPLSFDYGALGTGGSTANELAVGGLAAGACCVNFNPPTNDFWLQIPDFFTAPRFQQLGYSQSSTGSESLFFTDSTNPLSGGTVSVTLVGPVTGVPEPSTWAMLIAGFAGMGLVGWKRRLALY